MSDPLPYDYTAIPDNVAEAAHLVSDWFAKMDGSTTGHPGGETPTTPIP